jgi:hypothetical protein
MSSQFHGNEFELSSKDTAKLAAGAREAKALLFCRFHYIVPPVEAYMLSSDV